MWGWGAKGGGAQGQLKFVLFKSYLPAILYSESRIICIVKKYI